MTVSTGQTYWFHRHPALTLLALVLIGCIGALILAEFAARALFHVETPRREERIKFWKYDELLGWSHIPNQKGRLKHDDSYIQVVNNSQGLRDREYPIERTEKKRMLVLGDSFGWGFGVEQNERFSELLENAHPGWEIINASVSGYGTAQEFLFLKERGIAYKPDVVLLLFCDNDFENNIRGDEYWYLKPFFTVEGEKLKLHNVPVPKASMMQRIDRYLIGTTYLWPRLFGIRNWLNGLLEFFKSAKTNNNKSPKIQNIIPYSPEARAKIYYDVTNHLIKAMNNLCKGNGSMFILVSVPMNVEFMQFLQKVAAEERIPYLSLKESFESNTATTFSSDGHWNQKGHKIAANAIGEFLRKTGLFKLSKP